MKAYKTYRLTLLFCLVGFLTFGQDNQREKSSEDDIFTIKGSVYMQDSRAPVEEVAIEVNNGTYTTTNKDGKFTVKAKIGDQLIVRHNSFETIFYTIISSERITIEVASEDDQSSKRFRSNNITKRFNEMIDSADVYLKKDAEKSIKFIGDALNVNVSSSQSAKAHELLGDVYMHWKQYDLAISAYKISIQNTNTASTKLKLAKAFQSNGDFQTSISTYENLNETDLSNYEKITLYEGIGDANLKIKNIPKAISYYEEGLKVAKKHLIVPKITDLNSKIAQAYSEKGEKSIAKDYYSNSLNLAKKENKKRAVEEQIKVAEFNSDNEDYENEIVLRKQAIKGIEDIEKDSIISNESPITSQKQNYKIGNAYLLNNDLANAIPYFEKSRAEADKKEDLDVKMDATRKLSEVNFRSGNIEKGIEYNDEFKNVVDELYAKKVQEISRAARFSKNIAEQQNRITSLESDRELSKSKYELTQERNKSQQLIIYSLIGGLVLLLVTAYFMFKYIKQQKLANNLLALKSLRSQMNPHFIFNALNSVNSFIATNDERTANKYLSDFSQLMRAVLENSEEDFIPLKKEIELLDLYAKLEHFRFQDKFDYSIDVDDTIDVEEFQIPPMLLQPYIENAVWHGLRYKTEKGHLNIAIQPKSKDEITITISDDGIGRTRSKALKTENQKKQNSKGMNNIKKRVAILNEMYKDKVDVTIEDFQDLKDTGTKVVVTLKKISMKLSAIIVEDEETSRAILKNYLTKYCPNISIIGEAANVEEALVLIRNNDLDVVFLDVEMPYGNAFDLLDKVGDINFETIFVTAYNHYAIEALNAHASYYLMKPISIDELIKAVDYVTEIRTKEDALQDQVLVPKANSVNGKITIPQQNGFEVIETADIMYCKADDNYTEIYLNTNKKKLVSKTLKYIEESLKDANFARVHKSYLVNVNEVVKYVKGKGGSVVLSNGKEIMVSASKKSDLLSYFK